jgi:CRISPR-associated protein Csn2
MKLAHHLLSSPLKITEEKVNILVIENQKFFLELLTDLNNQVNKIKGNVVLSFDNTPIEISKNLEMITEFIPFELNKRNILSKLLKRADAISQSESFFMRTKELYSQISEFAQLLADEIEFDIDYLLEYEVSCILKAINFKLRDDYASISEKIIDYMLLVREFENDKCFVLVNFRNYVSNSEIIEFYKTVLYHKLKVLIVSASDYPLSSYETKTIIDMDLCQI